MIKFVDNFNQISNYLVEWLKTFQPCKFSILGIYRPWSMKLSISHRTIFHFLGMLAKYNLCTT
jgi:hypothetical protein